MQCRASELHEDRQRVSAGVLPVAGTKQHSLFCAEHNGASEQNEGVMAGGASPPPGGVHSVAPATPVQALPAEQG